MTMATWNGSGSKCDSERPWDGVRDHGFFKAQKKTRRSGLLIINFVAGGYAVIGSALTILAITDFDNFSLREMSR